MKRSISVVATLIAILSLAPLHIASAQACSLFFPLEEGVRLEYTHYNDKDKIEGTQWQEIRNVEETSEGTEARMHIGFQDEKGKEAFESEYTFVCQGDVVRIDYKSLMSGQMLEQFGDAEMEITGTDVEWPNDLRVGMELPDANVAMKIDMGGINMNMVVNITGRKVERKETLTTQAGTFDCFVIYSESQSKMMMANQTFPSRMWLAEGVGMVQTETYNKKGKSIGRSVLTSISR